MTETRPSLRYTGQSREINEGKFVCKRQPLATSRRSLRPLLLST